MNYIFDGEIHPLSEDYAYIMKYVDDKEFNLEDLGNHKEYLKNKEECLGKFIEYLIKNNYLIFIYRPASGFDECPTKGTFAIKFKRLPNDGLS